MILRSAPPAAANEDFEPLTIVDIEQARRLIETHVIRTPAVPWPGYDVAPLLAAGTRISAKLELLQRTGSFKARGAMVNLLSLTQEQRRRGVTAVSAGNHAIATAWAAKFAGVSAKVVMIGTANQRRIELTRSFGAEIVMATNAQEAFATADRLVAEEGRVMIHPFEGRRTASGTATVGAELIEQIPDLDAVIVPIGGGGLIAGVAVLLRGHSPQRGRSGARRRRRPSCRHATHVPRREAGRRARRRRRAGGSAGPVAGPSRAPARRPHRVRIEHRHRDVRSPPDNLTGPRTRQVMANTTVTETDRSCVPGWIGVEALSAPAEAANS